MKKPIDQKDIEKDVNRLMSFLNNMDSIDIENVDMDKLENINENTDLSKLIKELKEMQKDLDIKK